MSSRLRTVFLATSAAVGIASAALLAAPGAAPAGAAPAGAPGNNGTVKIHEGAGEPSPEPRNEPHVCIFHVHALFFDAGQVLTFTVQSWEPTGDRSVVLAGSITADTSGAGRAPVTGAYSLPDGHYRLTVDTGNGTPTQDKHKMFWVRCAPETSPPSSPSSPPGSPTTAPGSPTTAPGSPTTPPGSPSTPPTSPTSPSGSVPSSSGPISPTSPGASPTTQAGGAVPPVPPSAGGLAFTGSSALGAAGLGLALVLAGIGLLLLPAARRRLLGD
jgi:hypothetical protein